MSLYGDPLTVADRRTDIFTTLLTIQDPAVPTLHEPFKTVVHLTMRHDDIELAIGTGVLYRRHDQVYITTAWHNVSGLHAQTMATSSRHAAVPNNIVASVPALITRGGEQIGYGRSRVTVPLENETHGLYLVHP